MSVCCEHFFVRYKYIHRSYHSSGGVVTSVACLECDRVTAIVQRPWPTAGYCAMGKKNRIFEEINDWIKTKKGKCQEY